MANIKSADKRHRQNVVRYARNHSRISRVRTFIRKFEEAVLERNIEKAKAAFNTAESEIARGVSKGVLHRNTASRTVSRLNKRLRSVA